MLMEQCQILLVTLLTPTQFFSSPLESIFFVSDSNYLALFRIPIKITH